VSRWLPGIGYRAADLRLALVEAAGGTIGGWQDRLVLLCSHFDPATGRYSGIVQRATEFAVGFTVLLVGGWIGRQLHRERRRTRDAPAAPRRKRILR
jgi:protein SCO1/2